MHSRPLARQLLWLGVLLLVPSLAWAQGQLINGNRTLTGTLNAATTTGTGNAYVLTLNPAITAYVLNQCFTFNAHLANTGAATLNINGVGARPLRKYIGGALSELPAGAIAAGQLCYACYDGSAMQVMGGGEAASGAIGASLGLNVAAPATPGALAQTGGANNMTMQTLKRATDTAPTGIFAEYQNAAGTGLWRVDITGSLTAGGVPWARLTAIPDAVADGVTKGVVAPAASDFNTTAGVLTLDYANAQPASASTKGFLTSADWGTFNAKQNALGFTPESTANKSPAVGLGPSDTLYPTQNAVKVYVDGGLASKQPLLTFGAGLALSGTTVDVFSAESGFLTNGGASPLTCGASNQGRMQVLANGELQYCDGATTSVLHSGLPTQSGLKWLVNPALCTGDGNAGKLTVNASQEILCAADIGGAGGGGGVTSVFSRTGVVTAQPGDYTAAQVTNAASTTAANTFTHASGQSMPQLVLPGTTSGTTTVKGAAVAGASLLILPAGTTDFSSTGGVSQVLRQTAPGGAITVGPLSTADVGLGAVDNTSDASKNSATATLENKFVVPRALTCTPSANVITPNADSMDICEYYSLTAATLIANPTATLPNPRPHQRLEVALKSVAPQALTHGTNFDATCGQPLPTSTTGSGGALDYFLYVYSPSTLKWCLRATSQPPAAVTGLAGSTGFVMLPMAAAFLPATNMAVIDVSEANPRLLFDATTSECAWWSFKMPPDYTSTPVLKFPYSMTSATGAVGVAIDVAIAAVSPGDALDAQARAYATSNICTDATVPSTLGGIKEISCALTNNDSLAARDLVRLKVCRATANAADTATGDMEGIGAAMLEYTR